MPDLLDDVCQHPRIEETNLYDDPVPANMVGTEGGDPEAARPTVVGGSDIDSDTSSASEESELPDIGPG